MMTLDNLKSMRDKAARLNKWTTQQKEPNPEYLRWSQAQYEKYDKEIKRRLAYINKPVNEKKKLAAKDPYQDAFELGHHAPKFDPGSLSHDIDRVRETNQNEFDMGQKHQTWNLLPARDLVLLWATFAKYGRGRPPPTSPYWWGHLLLHRILTRHFFFPTPRTRTWILNYWYRWGHAIAARRCCCATFCWTATAWWGCRCPRSSSTRACASSPTPKD